jgi:CHORD
VSITLVRQSFMRGRKVKPSYIPLHSLIQHVLTSFAGWKCCKPRVLTFDEFLEIPPCTTGKHSTVDDTPAPDPKPVPSEDSLPAPAPPKPIAVSTNDAGFSELPSRPLAPVAPPTPSRSPAPPPESESDDPSASIAPGATCKRRGCNKTYNGSASRDDEVCVHHPGAALFHEGSKGWTCCKRRVLEFEEFMKIEGCKTKKRHLFVGKETPSGEEKLEAVR